MQNFEFEKIEKDFAKKVVVFCPKNAFKAWKDEFVENFGKKKVLNILTVDDDVNLEYEL